METTMTDVTFDDLLEIRKGEEGLTMGSGPSRIGTVSNIEEWEIKAAALRDIFRQTLGRKPDVDCPLDQEVVEEKNHGDHIRRTIAYNLAPDERINGYLLIPKNLKGKAPAVLCIHQTTPFGKEQVVGTDESEVGRDLSYALHLVREGFVTFAYDLLTANERKYKDLRDFETAPFYEKFPEWSIRGKDLWDVQKALDLLETIDEVDPRRIGSIGHSQGGGITIHAMALEPRIQAGVSSCGDWPARLSKNPFNHARTGWWVGRPFLRPYCYTGKQFPIDLHEYLALAAPRSIMPINALNDFAYSLDEAPLTRPIMEAMSRTVSKVFALYSVESNFQQILHEEKHSFHTAQRETAYTFLKSKLGF
ncbi:MAG: hypothetical protein CME25_17240 [Gemmatimonadetes bacterium]|nr:hypothetical protein [Gemmatimonadota bacterium]|tara:strand:+ start:205 stop:1293 length:1089 start_codon:yes stop_codon:yes gene_type:complete